MKRLLVAVVSLAVLAAIGTVVTYRLGPEQAPRTIAQIQSGTVFLNGKRLTVPVVFEWTETTLICNGMDAAPLEPYDEADPWPDPPVDFGTACGLYLKKCRECCLAKGSDKIDACLDQLLLDFDTSPFISTTVVAEDRSSLVAYGGSGKSLRVDLLRDNADLTTLREAEDTRLLRKAANNNTPLRKAALRSLKVHIEMTIADGGLLVANGTKFALSMPPESAAETLPKIESICGGVLTREEKIFAISNILGHDESAEQLVDNCDD